MASPIIRSFRYDSLQQQLTITFRSGRVYAYRHVPENIFRGLRAAFPKGEFYNSEIRDRYVFDLIRGARPSF